MRFNSTKKAAVDRNLLSGSPGPQCGGLGHLPTGGFFAAVPIKLNHSAEQIALSSNLDFLLPVPLEVHYNLEP